ncbi:unnamed protein product [Urochloa humidicola]
MSIPKNFSAPIDRPKSPSPSFPIYTLRVACRQPPLLLPNPAWLPWRPDLSRRRRPGNGPGSSRAAAAPWGAHGRACLYGNQTSCSPAWGPSVEASADRRRPDVDAAAAISVSRYGINRD